MTIVSRPTLGRWVVAPPAGDLRFDRDGTGFGSVWRARIGDNEIATIYRRRRDFEITIPDFTFAGALWPHVMGSPRLWAAKQLVADALALSRGETK